MTIVSRAFRRAVAGRCRVLMIPLEGIELQLHRRETKVVSDPTLRSVEELYTVGDVLGKGGFGEVKKAFHLEESRYYAIKFIPEGQAGSASHSLDEAARARYLRYLREEIEILKRVQHSHIVQFKEAVRYGAQGLGASVWPMCNATPLQLCPSGLVMELMHGGDLEQYLHGHGPLCEFKLAARARDILTATSTTQAEWNTKYLAHQICSALAVSDPHGADVSFTLTLS